MFELSLHCIGKFSGKDEYIKCRRIIVVGPMISPAHLIALGYGPLLSYGYVITLYQQTYCLYMCNTVAYLIVVESLLLTKKRRTHLKCQKKCTQLKKFKSPLKEKMQTL